MLRSLASTLTKHHFVTDLQIKLNLPVVLRRVKEDRLKASRLGPFDNREGSYS